MRDCSEIDGEQLLQAIRRNVSHSIGGSLNEDIISEITLVILSGEKIDGQRVTAKSLNPAIVRKIANRVRRSTESDKFRHVSLDHQYGEDGQRLEERLAG